MEMDCTQAREEFASILDGELAPEERAAVEGHLSQCSECLRDLDGLKRVDTLYRRLSSVTAPEGFEEGVRQGIRSSMMLRFPRLGRPRRRMWPVALVAAGFLFVIAAVAVQFVFPSDTNMQVALLDQQTTAAPPASPSPAPAEMPAMKAETSNAVEKDLNASPNRIVMGIGQAPPNESGGGKSVDETTEGAREDKGVPMTPPEKKVAKAPARDRAEVQAAPAPAAKPEAEPAKPLARSLMAAAAPPPAAETPVLSAPSPPAAQAAPPVVVAEAAAPKKAFSADSAQASNTVNMPAESAPQPAPAPAETAAGAPPTMGREVAGVGAMLEVKSKAPEAASGSKRAGNRDFVLKDGVWRESGYADQVTTRLVRGSQDLQKLVSAHPELGEALEIGERVVLKVGDRWYRVEPHPAK